MKTEPTSDYQLEAFVEFRGQVKQLVIEFFKSKVSSGIINDHTNLGLVEECPHLINRLEVVPCHLMELALRWIEFLLILSTHHFMIKVKKPFYLWNLFYLESGKTQE